MWGVCYSRLKVVHGTLSIVKAPLGEANSGKQTTILPSDRRPRENSLLSENSTSLSPQQTPDCIDIEGDAGF